MYYQIYGLNLTVNIALPGPTEIDVLSSDLPTIDVRLGELPNWLTEVPSQSETLPWYVSTTKLELEGNIVIPTLQVWQIEAPSMLTAVMATQSFNRSGQYFYCRYCDGTIFVVSRLGTQIWATWPEDLTIEDTATYLLGPILGFVLRLRGTVCFHASAIAIQDRVVVLVGAAGAGKSTTAAAFAQQGYQVLSDDVVPIVDLGDKFLIQPAYPRIRLWNESVRALYGNEEALPRLVPTHPTWDKRYLDLNQTGYQFRSQPLPLAAIYYLDERSDDRLCPKIAPMPDRDRLITLISNTYANYLLEKRLRAQEFELLSRVVKYIPVSQITPHQDVSRLADLMATIVSDVSIRFG